MSGDRMVRGCCWGAARVLEEVGVDADPVTEIEDTYRLHRRDLGDARGSVDYVKLAALHLDRITHDLHPTLF